MLNVTLQCSDARTRRFTTLIGRLLIHRVRPGRLSTYEATMTRAEVGVVAENPVCAYPRFSCNGVLDLVARCIAVCLNGRESLAYLPSLRRLFPTRLHLAVRHAVHERDEGREIGSVDIVPAETAPRDGAFELHWTEDGLGEANAGPFSYTPLHYDPWLLSALAICHGTGISPTDMPRPKQFVPRSVDEGAGVVDHEDLSGHMRCGYERWLAARGNFAAGATLFSPAAWFLSFLDGVDVPPAATGEGARRCEQHHALGHEAN